MKYLTVEEFAKATQKHVVTIRKAIQAGEINAAQRKPRAHYRIPETEIHKYLGVAA